LRLRQTQTRDLEILGARMRRSQSAMCVSAVSILRPRRSQPCKQRSRCSSTGARQTT
jgi:hypothetical protein